MKKTYIAPQVQVVEFSTEALFLGTSPVVNLKRDGEGQDGMNALSGEKQWAGSSIWNND